MGVRRITEIVAELGYRIVYPGVPHSYLDFPGAKRMSFQHQKAILPESAVEFSRTELSVAFELFWRSLPKQGHLPHRRAFLPERAPRFLRNLVLCELSLDGGSLARMRLIGSAFEELIRRNLKGEDFLQYLPPVHHAGAIESARHILTRPCGLWQVTPLHFERGIARNFEFTALPLGPGTDGAHLLLVLTQELPGWVTPKPTIDQVMIADTALVYHYIDIGAGVPE